MPSANRPCPSPSAVRPYSSASIRKKCSPGTPCMEVLKMQESQTSLLTLNLIIPCSRDWNGDQNMALFVHSLWTSKQVGQTSPNSMDWQLTTVSFAAIRG